MEDEAETGIKVLVEPQNIEWREDAIDIVAIHGVGALSQFTWRSSEGTDWLQQTDMLPQAVPGARIMRFGYESRWFRVGDKGPRPNAIRVKDIASYLLNQLELYRRDTDRPILFIAHSYGGLVLLCALRDSYDRPEKWSGIYQFTAGILSFGTPFRGRDGITLEEMVLALKEGAKDGMHELDLESDTMTLSIEKNEYLDSIVTKFCESRRGDDPVPLVCFYETQKSPIKKLLRCPKLQNQIVVDRPSACLDISKNVEQIPLARHHYNLQKFRGVQDPEYQTVRNHIVDLAQNSRTRQILAAATATVSKAPQTLVQLSDKHFECLRSLAFREQEHRHNDIRVTKNSCRWLLQDFQYQNWMNTPTGLFWIEGNPGSGKSVLMKFASTELKDRKPGELVVSFFIHGRGMPLQKTPLGIFRALLHSMLTSFPEHLSKLTERFHNQEKKFGSYQQNRWDWSEQELQAFMSQVLTKGTKKRPIAIFIDALDECGTDDAKRLLRYFKELMDEVEREEGQAKICISSRHYPMFVHDKIPTTVVEKNNAEDIRQFVQEQLKEIQPPKKRQEIETEISSRAQGGFLWTVLITDIMIDENAIGTSKAKLLKKLAATPEALNELYGNILGGESAAERDQTIKLFMWVYFAQRPLSAQELREALATDKDMTYTTVSELKYHGYQTDDLGGFEKRIKHLSQGLVEFQSREIWEQYEPGGEESDREAQFIHQTVADFVVGEFLSKFRSRYASESLAGAGHFEVSRSCIRYLTLKEVIARSRQSRSSLSGKYPLLPYIIRFLIKHIREVEQEGLDQSDLLSLFQWNSRTKFWKNLASLWRIMDPHNVSAPMGWPYTEATPLHALIALGSKSAFDAFLAASNVRVDARDSEGNTPLLLAIRENQHEMALELINRSIKWQHRREAVTQAIDEDKRIELREQFDVSINAKNNDDETALTIAVQERAGDVIFKLLEAGADLKMFGKQTELVFCAIRNRDERLFSKLLDEKVKLDGAVYYALRELSHDEDDPTLEDFIDKLLRAGANTTKIPENSVEFQSENEDEDEYQYEDKDEDTDEAILLASQTGQVSMISLLLSYGASATLKNGDGSSPLMLALQNGHEMVVRILIGNGADVSAKNNDGSSPLMLASKNGNEMVVRTLIGNGADVNAKNNDGSSSLMLASRNGHEIVVKILIDTGADANVRGGRYGSALQAASDKGYTGIVQLLVGAGADVNIRDGEYENVLQTASKEDHEDIVPLLVDARAVRGSYLGSALQAASAGGHMDIIQLLVDAGADVNVRGGYYGTALQAASARGYIDMVQLLVGAGADINAQGGAHESAIHAASLNSHRGIVKLLVDAGADVNIRGGEQGSALCIASDRGHIDIVQLLVSAGADINVRGGHYGSALQAASAGGHRDILQLLVDAGADVNVRGGYYGTALQAASTRGYIDMVQLLVGAGADINAQGGAHGSALQAASEKGHRDIIQLLVDAGADINIRGGEYRSTLHTASEEDHRDIVQLLVGVGAHFNVEE